MTTDPAALTQALEPAYSTNAGIRGAVAGRR
jgi:hypothetical protein